MGGAGLALVADDREPVGGDHPDGGLPARDRVLQAQRTGHPARREDHASTGPGAEVAGAGEPVVTARRFQALISITA